MNVGERVSVSIPATEAEVETSNGGIVIIDNDNLFEMRNVGQGKVKVGFDYLLMVRPEFDGVCWEMRYYSISWCREVHLSIRYGLGDGGKRYLDAIAQVCSTDRFSEYRAP